MESCFVKIRLQGLREKHPGHKLPFVPRGRYSLGHNVFSIVSIRPNLNVWVVVEDSRESMWLCIDSHLRRKGVEILLTLQDKNCHLGLAQE